MTLEALKLLTEKKIKYSHILTKLKLQKHIKFVQKITNIKIKKMQIYI